MRKYLIIGGALLTLLAGFGIYSVYSWATTDPITTVVTRTVNAPGPDAQTVVAVSLKAIQSQSKLVPMEASYVAVVTTEETRMAFFKSRKTLIMPGRVRYEVDLRKLKQTNLDWDGATKTLRVKLPPIEISEPQIDLNGLKSYSDGMLTSFSGVNESLDAQNRRAGLDRLSAQARNPETMKIARDAATRAVSQMFEMPLRAAGVEGRAIVSF